MKRELFIDEFIVPFTPLTELEGIAQGYAIIKTAEDLENIANQSYQYPFGFKILLCDDIIYVNRVSLLFIGDCELNGNGHTITVISHLFEQVGTGISQLCTVKNLKVVIDTDTASGAITRFVVGGLIDNCIVVAKFTRTGTWGCVSEQIVEGSIIKNCNIKAECMAGDRVSGGITAYNIRSIIENCFIEIKLSHYGSYAYFGSIAFNSVASTIKNCTAIIRGDVVGEYYNYSMHLCPLLKDNSIILESECYFKMENNG